MLEVTGLSVKFGKDSALCEADLVVRVGEVVCVIGPNASGKSTLARALAGLCPYAGTVRLDGRDLNGLSTSRRVGAGLSMIEEGRGLVGNLTVLDNLWLGLYSQRRSNPRADISTMESRFPFLGERRDQLAATLSGGEQQLLAIARALLANPKCLIVDEPLLGLSPANATDVLSALREAAFGRRVLVLEQSARATLEASDRAYFLERGSVTRSGRAADFLAQDLLAASVRAP